jgi:hypothetical protein
VVAQSIDSAIPDYDVVFEADRVIASDLTVVVSLENSEPFLKGVIDSVAGQNVSHIDLLIIDHCSERPVVSSRT